MVIIEDAEKLERALTLIGAAKDANEVHRSALLVMAEEVLKELLPGTGKRFAKNIETTAPSPSSLSFPLAIYARRKGKVHHALLLRDQGVQVNSKLHRSPSEAGSTVTGYPVNGWRFWRFRTETGEERPIDDLRRQGFV